MTIRNSWKRVIAGTLAVLVVAGTVPGNLGINWLFSGNRTSITAYAAGATTLTAETTTWESGDYVVPEGGLTISGHITVNGTVNLTLPAGTTLTANMGITLSDGATINVSGEGAMVVKGSNGNANSTVAGTGTLVLKSGTVTVTGGTAATVARYGTSSNAGGVAVNGAVIVNGGTLNATGGIGGSLSSYTVGARAGAGGTAISGNVTVNAGTVTATGGNGGSDAAYAAGARAGDGGVAIGGDATINGGTWTATDGSAGAKGPSEDGMSADGTVGAGGASYNGTLTLGANVKLYEGTGNNGTVLDGNDSSSRVYSGAKKASMYAEGPDISQGPDKTALNDAITAAETLYNSIKDNTDYADIASTFQTAINTAKAVAESDEVDQDAVDAAATAISTAKATAETAQKDVDDTKEANVVIEKINALPASTAVTTENKTAIEAARTTYDALTQEQKEKVSSTTYVKLLDAEKALAAAEKEAADTEAANTVISQINALPASTAVTLSHKNSIESARTAYDALTADQQAKVPTNTYNKLTADEAAIATLEKNAADTTAANAVRNLINALPVSTAVTLTDKADIEEARAAYDALTEDQKSKIATNTLNRLTNAESALADAEQKEATDTAAAKSVTDAINALPASTAVTVNNKNSIEAARSAYNALTAEQKAKISSGTYNKLIEAETALAAAEKEAADTSAANAVITQINALPASTAVTLSHKNSIEAARTAYDALTADQQTKVPTNTYNKLTADEVALASAEKNAADTAAANTVTTQINALPASTAVTVDDNKNIKSARAAYDALTADQKAKVSNTTYKKLTDAEAALEIENVNTASAKAVSDQINALPESTAVTLANKTSIEAARKAYDELSADQKVKVSSDTYDKLISVETALAAAEKEAADTAAANTVSNVINALPASADVTVDDKENIEAARTAYDALTADQKAKVPGNTYNKLTADETALAAVEKEIADTAAAKAVTDMIGDFPANADITVDDKEDIEAARTAYDALTPDQKAKVSDYTYTRLINAESALEKEETDTAAAKAATDLISALPASADVTVDDKENIEAARTAYDALTADQKAKVSDDTYKKLTEAEATLKKEEDDTAAANTVADMIDVLPSDTDVTIDDKTAVEAARAAYDELTPDQQAKVSRDAYNKLTNAETAISEAEKNAALTAQSEAEQAKKDADARLASVVSDILNALPTTEDITKENASAVSNARLIFDMLTDDQKAMVSEDAIKKLTDDEAAVAALEEEAKIVKGDVNFDGKINTTDIVKVAAHVKGKKLLDKTAAKAADVNNDGKINITDIIKIAAHVKGKELLK